MTSETMNWPHAMGMSTPAYQVATLQCPSGVDVRVPGDGPDGQVGQLLLDRVIERRQVLGNLAETVGSCHVARVCGGLGQRRSSCAAGAVGLGLGRLDAAGSCNRRLRVPERTPNNVEM